MQTGKASPMAKVEIYTKDYCPFCHRAKALLERYGVRFTEYDLIAQPERTAEMRARSDGARTVPQVFINDRLVGGSDDLAALDRTGALADLLAVEAVR